MLPYWSGEDSDTEAFDDVRGGPLLLDKSRAAREVEMEFVKSRAIYEYRPVKECLGRTGKSPIGVKWVDTNKGDNVRPNIRSRLVATEMKRPWGAKWFAATLSSALPQSEVAPEKRSEPAECCC